MAKALDLAIIDTYLYWKNKHVSWWILYDNSILFSEKSNQIYVGVKIRCALRNWWGHTSYDQGPENVALFHSLLVWDKLEQNFNPEKV